MASPPSFVVHLSPQFHIFPLSSFRYDYTPLFDVTFVSYLRIIVLTLHFNMAPTPLWSLAHQTADNTLGAIVLGMVGASM